MSGTAILVARLNEYIDPAWLFGAKLAEFVGRAAARPEFKELTEDRNEQYDRGRIAYFRDQFLAGAKVDAIVLDCVCHNGHVYPDALMIDGWHRFSGALLAGVERIKANFSGRVDLLRYLQGRRKTKPRE